MSLYREGYKAIPYYPSKETSMKNPVANMAAVIVLGALVFIGAISFGFKGSIHF